MTKLINKENIKELSKQLETIQEDSAILIQNDYIIDGRTYYEGGDTKANWMSIEYLNSGISEIIEIDTQGRISLDNNTNEYSPMYGEDLEDITKVAKILTTWWNNLTEVKL